MTLAKENDMRKYISILMILITLFYSSVFAAVINVNEETFKDESLIFPDLQIVATDERGRVKYDRTTGKTLYRYHKATNEILKASAIGLIEGYDDGTFKPDESITKGEFIKLAVVLATNRNFDFSAIPTNLKHWAAPYVAVAEMQNVVNVGEYNDNNLDEAITRIEMICILSKIQINMKGVYQYRDAELPAYIDIDTLTEEEKDLLLHAAKYELISEMYTKNADGVYAIRPYDNLTRGDAAMAIMRIY